MSTIKEDLTELKDWWMDNKNVWFNSTEKNDEEIAIKYLSLFNSDVDISLLNNIDSQIGYIILKDQVCRHIVRTNVLDKSIIQTSLNEIIEFVSIFYEINKNDINFHDFCFVLLPLRHTNLFSIFMPKV